MCFSVPTCMHKIIRKQSVALLELILFSREGGKIVAYPKVFQLLNDEISAHH